MPYTPTTWVNGSTKLSAANLNNLETGVSGATTTAEAAVPKSTGTAQGDLITFTAASTPARLPVGTSTQVLHGGTTPTYSAVVEADITLADNTTNNVSTTKHGFVPKLPNDANKFFDGTGAFSVPPATSVVYPWLVDVNVFPTAISQTNWDTILGEAATDLYGWAKSSSGAQNAEICWDVVLAAGTWTVELIHHQAGDRGIYSVQFDTVEQGTIDGYNAVETHNVRSSVSGITVAATAKVRLKLKMATKNASSSSYKGVVHHVQLRRTA